MSTVADIEQTASDFFLKMEEFGFLSHIEGELPPEFTVVYEIARILENEAHPLSTLLAPVLADSAPAAASPNPAPTPVPHQYETVEYEAHLLRHTHEISKIYPHQFLLPEEVFFRRLVNRSLWLPREIPPNNFRYRADSDTFAPDTRKQKVYLLLDTSSSMTLRYRIHLLKAIAYIFLRRNMHELGTVFMRTFDVEVGALRIANDEASFNRLLMEIMNIASLGNGTVLWKALQTAVKDIRALDDLHEAEILVVTDGAVHLETDKVRELLGSDITLHTVKLGDEDIQPHPNFLKDEILRRKDRRSLQVQKLYEKEHDIEFRLRSVGGEHLRVALERELATIREHITHNTKLIADEIRATYGREIVELSEVYVQVPDINPKELFKAHPEQLHSLLQLTKEMMEHLREFSTANTVKQSALLLSHLEFLLQFNPDQQELSATTSELQEALKEYIEEADDVERDTHTAHFSMMEQKQINLLLRSVGTGKRLSWAKLLRYLWARSRRFIRLMIQRTKYRNIRALSRRLLANVGRKKKQFDNPNDVFS